jgi:hypothetical protein
VDTLATYARVRNSSVSGVKRGGRGLSPKSGTISRLEDRRLLLTCVEAAIFQGQSVAHEIAENLRQLAMECSQLAKECSDKTIANEIEGISAELAGKARRLDTLFGEDGKRHSQAGL